MKESLEISLLVSSEIKRTNFPIEIRIRVGSLAVEINDRLQSRHHAVVHVGRGERYVAQRRRLELATVGIALGDLVASKI